MDNYIVTFTVAVYDTQKKKCIAIFSSANRCAIWISDTANKKWNSNVMYWIKNKTVSDRNRFEKPLAFRPANSIQVAQLGTHDELILDDDYKFPTIEKRSSGFEKLQRLNGDNRRILSSIDNMNPKRKRKIK